MSDIEKSEITEDEDKEQDLDEKVDESSDESVDEEEMSTSLEDLRDEVADAYLTFLDTKKEWAIATAASLWVSLNPLRQWAIDYMLATPKEDEWVFDKIWKKLKKEMLKKISGWEMLEYNQADLKKMKELIKENKDNASALEAIRAQIEQGIDPTQKSVDPVDSKVSATWVATNTEVATVVSSNAIEVLPDWKQAQVLKVLDDVLKYDEKHPVEYDWWWRNDISKWLDCSGLLIYSFHQAGFESVGGDSREMFKKLPTTKLEMNDDWKFKDLTNIKPGDSIFWNTTNPDYDWSAESIPTIKKDEKDYRIHHVAFIKSVDVDSGKLVIVESNWRDWVIEREIDYKHELQETNHKSELFVWHIDYEGLLAYDGEKDEHLSLAA